MNAFTPYLNTREVKGVLRKRRDMAISGEFMAHNQRWLSVGGSYTLKTEKTPEQCLLVAGGLHIDELATVLGPVHMHASNPVSWQHHIGGAAANAAQAIRRVQASKADVLLAAAAGTDQYAQILMKGLHQSGLKVFQQIVKNRDTGRYSAIVDAHGNLLLGLADTSLAEQLRAEFVNELISRFRPAGVLLDSNLSVHCLTGICEFCGECDIPVAVIAVSPVKTPRVAVVATGIGVLYCNRGEAETLTESHPATPILSVCDKLTAQGFRRFVLTDGPRDIIVQTLAARHVLPVVSMNSLKTTNGPGDALAGASFAKWVAGMALHDSVREAGIPAAQSIASGTSKVAMLQSGLHALYSR